MGPDALAQVLREIKKYFPAQQHPELLVGLDVSDDAAVYKINEEIAVIQTIDFFTPVVDDPYDYGAIAAANAMSDVYAMGGEVVLALNVCGFPKDLPKEIIADILRGGAEKVVEAGGVLVGGHTVDDKEPKYGLSVMGRVHPDKVLTKGGAKPGDALLLTKPLGVGIITTAAKGDAAETDHIKAAIESMKHLNKDAAQIIQKIGVNACTDVTGFALLGHAYEMAERSGVQFRFSYESIPFHDGARKYAEERLFPGGACKNQDCFEKSVTFSSSISKEMRTLLFTPETSGGLLFAVDADKCEEMLSEFKSKNLPVWHIAEVRQGEGIVVD